MINAISRRVCRPQRGRDCHVGFFPLSLPTLLLISMCIVVTTLEEADRLEVSRRTPNSYVVVDGLGQKLAFLYFEDQPQRQMSMRRLGRYDAWRIA